jgi:hypothetical protein
MEQRLNFLPLPDGQRSFGPIRAPESCDCGLVMRASFPLKLSLNCAAGRTAVFPTQDRSSVVNHPIDPDLGTPETIPDFSFRVQFAQIQLTPAVQSQ